MCVIAFISMATDWYKQNYDFSKGPSNSCSEKNKCVGGFPDDKNPVLSAFILAITNPGTVAFPFPGDGRDS